MSNKKLINKLNAMYEDSVMKTMEIQLRTKPEENGYYSLDVQNEILKISNIGFLAGALANALIMSDGVEKQMTNRH
jgi:hypothetical protein